MKISIWISITICVLTLGACGGSGGTPLDIYDGTVSLTTTRGVTGTSMVMGGYFIEGTDIRRGLGCPLVREVGPCSEFSACTTLTPTDDAGTLTGSVDGVEVGSSTADSFYAAVATATPFSADQMITLETSGGTVPAFRGDVVAPPPLEATLPTTIVAGADVTFTWNASIVADAVELGVNSGTTIVICSVDASAGTLTVDSSITADLSATAQLNLKSLNITPVMAGDYDVAVIAGNNLAGTTTVE